MDIIQLFQAAKITGYHRLIGHDNRQIPFLINITNGFSNSFYQFHLLRFTKQVHFFRDNPITIQKYGRSCISPIQATHLPARHIIAYGIITIGSTHILDVFERHVSEQVHPFIQTSGKYMLLYVRLRSYLYLLQNLRREDKQCGIHHIMAHEIISMRLVTKT